MRAIRRRWSRLTSAAAADYLLRLARELIALDHRWVAYELIRSHRQAFGRVGEAELKELGRGMDSWVAVDTFARILAGPAWLVRQVPDRAIDRWSRSEDRWWRRAALVSTVALNSRIDGGAGDARRTLRICARLVDDRDDMVVKALSWALRSLAWCEPQAVRRFLDERRARLAARVMREVGNKLTTGLKNARRGRTGA